MAAEQLKNQQGDLIGWRYVCVTPFLSQDTEPAIVEFLKLLIVRMANRWDIILALDNTNTGRWETKYRHMTGRLGDPKMVEIQVTYYLRLPILSMMINGPTVDAQEIKRRYLESAQRFRMMVLSQQVITPLVKFPWPGT